MENKKNQAKVVLLGSVAVGKTSLVQKIINPDHELDPDYQTTICAGYYETTVELEKTTVLLQLWDTAGMERYQTLGPIYYRGAIGALFVYDLSKPISEDELDEWLQMFEKEVSSNYCAIVVANKADLLNCDYDTMEMQNWAQSHGFGFMITSAKTGLNVSSLTKVLASQCLQILHNDASFDSPSLLLSDERQDNCC